MQIFPKVREAIQINQVLFHQNEKAWENHGRATARGSSTQILAHKGCWGHRGSQEVCCASWGLGKKLNWPLLWKHSSSVFFINQLQFWSVEKLHLSKKCQAEVSQDVSTSGAVENRILSSIHQDEKYFEISEFSGERVLQIPTIFI